MLQFVAHVADKHDICRQSKHKQQSVQHSNRKNERGRKTAKYSDIRRGVPKVKKEKGIENHYKDRQRNIQNLVPGRQTKEMGPQQEKSR